MRKPAGLTPGPRLNRPGGSSRTSWPGRFPFLLLPFSANLESWSYRPFRK
jgi:hypothetical protein